MDLKGQIAVVTGASRGVGRAIADALKARGLIVAKVARGSARFAADVSDPADVARLKTAVETELGRPTVLVNAAGIFGPIALVKDSDPKEWIETLMIDAVGPYLVSRAFLDGMIDGGWGRIVNLSSAASLHTPGPLNSAIAAHNLSSAASLQILKNRKGQHGIEFVYDFDKLSLRVASPKLKLVDAKQEAARHEY